MHVFIYLARVSAESAGKLKLEICSHLLESGMQPIHPQAP